MGFEKIVKSLQFDEVLNTILKFSKAEPNVENIKKLKPFNSIDEANDEIDEVSDFLKIINNESFPDIEIEDMSNIFILLKKEGGFLQPSEFLKLLNLFKITGAVKSLLEKLDDDFYRIKIKYTNKLNYFKYFENLIETTFDELGEFRDSASMELKSIRSKIRDTRNQILDKLNEFLFSGYFTNIIQETIVTIRNNRYVIPLKPNFAQRVKGIIQDYSSTRNTIFVEPDFVVQLNNKLAYLHQEEYNEKIRILTEITEEIKNNFYEIDQSYKTLITIDFKVAKAKMAKKFNFTPVALNENENKIFNAYNPLLLIHGKKVVPVDLLFENKKILIITGANTGGKTVALKTLGLITLMAKCGIPVPVSEKSKIKFFNKIFIDIGDEQDISSDLSTFSAHITNINSFLNECDHNTLIIIDELGTGTDPKDGAAIGRALIEFFIKKGSFAAITSHIEDLKYLNYIYNEVENVSVAFNEKSIKPQYRLIYGVSGHSYGISIAEKLNFNREVIELSKQFYNETSSEFLKQLIDIDNLKKELLEKERAIILERQQVKIERQKYLRLKEKISVEKNNIIEKLKEKYNKKYEKAISELEKFLNNEVKPVLSAKEYAKLMERKKRLESKIKKTLLRRIEKKKKLDYSITDFYVGKVVKHVKTGVNGRVSNIDIEKEKIEVIFENNLKLFLDYRELIPIEVTEEKKQNFYSYSSSNKLLSVNIIGKTVDEGISEVEKLLDYAILKGADKIEIIHGLGTGRLKKGIDEYLKNSQYVKNFYSPIDISGGMGITIAELK